MINANELRVGITLNILPFEKVGFNPVTIDKQRLIALLNGEETTYYPIPLTPEILVDWCGFEKWEMEDKAYITPFDRKRLILIFDDNGPGQINTYWIENVAMPEVSLTFNIEYLHQLQNLHLPLFGEELPVNKPEFAQ